MSDMNIFKWDKVRFTTYVDAMDSEHEGLVNLMNQLFQENSTGASKAQLLKTVGVLAQKTKQHFTNEEAYFSTIKDYTSVAPHKKIHDDLLKRFTEHVTQFQNSPANKFSDDFFMFLKVWLSAHICGVDRKYGELSKNRSA